MPASGFNCAHVPIAESADGNGDCRVWCGVYACRYECCDECYEAHVWSVHFFAAPDKFRVGMAYKEARVRGRWAERICRGHKTPFRTSDTGA